MNDRYLKFLDYILPKLSEVYTNGKCLSDLAHMYKKETQIIFKPNELQHFLNSYDDEYFQIHGNLDYAVITPETKTIIDKWGSLSKYIEEQNNLEIKALEEGNELNKLNIENLKLQNENLEYKKIIRNQEDRIRAL
ncbi:MAG: hypothetical protein JEY97_06640, partial [Bacteroidales bacterium]|nr:hypothetical protein [Bacteroidales bacterium]